MHFCPGAPQDLINIKPIKGKAGLINLWYQFTKIGEQRIEVSLQHIKCSGSVRLKAVEVFDCFRCVSKITFWFPSAILVRVALPVD